MNKKIENLNNLMNLLNSGAITQDEFDKLKLEIFKSDGKTDEELESRVTKLKELFESNKISKSELNELYEKKGITVEQYSIRKSKLSYTKKISPTKLKGSNKSSAIVKRSHKETVNNDKNTDSASGWGRSLIAVAIIIIMGGFLISVMFESVETSNSTVSPEQDDGKCSRCYGRKKVATYSQSTCSPSHFKYGDCGGHMDEYDCFSVGSKTCPCCNGSGRSS